ncbi:MAG: DUF393 domain-containing protein [Kiloniellales bacterium]|nr:DUF393 domain-containing protein [Kiloniellales bacterium]
MAQESGHKLKTYYNERCPVCSAGIHAYRASQSGDVCGLDWQDINQDETALAAQGVTRDDVWYRLHTVDEDGRILVGIDAFIAIWDELPAYRRRACLLRLPVVRQLAYLGYEALAFCLYRWNLWRARRGAG